MPLFDSLEDHLTQNPTTGCLEWSRCRSSDGYGRVSNAGETHYVHRVVYEKHHGPVPDGLLVRHTCDNPPCANPEHLVVGTQADNARDRDSRGRNGTRTHGRYAGRRKWEKKPREQYRLFTDTQVRAIRDRCARGEPKKALAREYGVSDAAILKIAKRQSYAYIV